MRFPCADLAAEFGDIAKGIGNLGKIRPASGHRGQPLPLLVLFENLQVFDADQGGHLTVAVGDDESFMTVGAPGNELGKMSFGLGNGNFCH